MKRWYLLLMWMKYNLFPLFPITVLLCPFLPEKPYLPNIRATGILATPEQYPGQCPFQADFSGDTAVGESSHN
jgi:hypothetical protein